MNEIRSGSGESPSAVCEEAVARYRQYGKAIQSPAIRKVIESVIHQKAEHAAILRPIEAGFECGGDRVAISEGAQPEDVLRGLVAHELSFAERLDVFAASLADEDSRLAVKAVAEASRKFASWAQDHLDLLAMF
ncbi:MAG: hypothetical protein KKA67_13080 [Spirochaetes bacterium]|nr:hypothetical protein [Spirochaetota bacterium]MBU1081679.1 hypothetical protein [Spirochaetota bacterium]